MVTDKGLAVLKDLPYLERLSLDETRVTDTGLDQLAGLKNLKYLSVWKTKVTSAGTRALQKSLPELTVNGLPEKTVDP